MGGNGSYIPSEGGVSEQRRTHDELDRRIDGHKILIQKKSPAQKQAPMNSNSENPIYLCGRKLKDGSIEIGYIAIYKDHKLLKTIDLHYDSNGNLIPYTNGKGSHEHNWDWGADGNVGRKSGKPGNHLPIEGKYKHLIDEIIDFNKEHYKWNKKS